jgi:GH24 family phage-related lysozyme (muramidase)
VDEWETNVHKGACQRSVEKKIVEEEKRREILFLHFLSSYPSFSREAYRCPEGAGTICTRNVGVSIHLTGTYQPRHDAADLADNDMYCIDILCG